MKNIKMFLLTVGLCGALAVSIASCERDNFTWRTDGSGVAGTYNVSAYNVPAAVDLNGDGTTSANLATESTCYTGSFLRLNSNYTYAMEDIVFNADSESGCDTIFSTGTWRRTDAILTTTSSEALSGGVSTDTDYNFSVEGGTLSKVILNGTYPASDGEGGFFSQTGDLNVTFTKAASN